ncbi:2-methoxy-6-polyprenyl-1,4-benzoquinol methylase [hydrothermal vent metagenome]|uniref:2-methoxy-6-polyprenyl-1,4-benzoquinol methylase n=1 Tax=hydrothermal vent metagenome TaxID=652676 RepID=A0A3B0YUP8_9ZZZZ
MSKTEKTTHFGYEQVATDDKQHKVADVFHSVAAKYDLMNDLMSMGVHRLWKRVTIERSGVKPGDKVLDVAGGTGDLAIKFSKLVGNDGLVVLTDINASMLATGRDRIIDQGIIQGIEYVQSNAEALPFADNTFDCITIAFGLRNVTHKDKALQSMARILKPGGRLLVLEFSKPTMPGLDKIYDFYSFNILPRIGQWVTQDSKSYQYLAESIRMHPDQESLKDLILKSGFDQCEYTNMTGGIVALHIGVKY